MYMSILHLLTFSSEFNAIPLRCPFNALAIVQVGFAGAEMFCAPSCLNHWGLQGDPFAGVLHSVAINLGTNLCLHGQ